MAGGETMWDWIFGVGGITVFIGIIGMLFWLLIKAQIGNRSQRGQDSSSPGGYYTDLGA
jgi:hypothetical protein